MNEEVFSSSDKQENLGMCALMAFIPILFFLPLVVENKKYSPYCMFRANQTLVTFLVMFAIGIVSGVLGILEIIPLIGLIIKVARILLGLVAGFFYIENLIFAILGSGKKVFVVGAVKLLK